MRLLIDECIDQRLRLAFPAHDCQTAGFAGLAGLKNGRLLDAAETAGFEVLITVDQNIPDQQNLEGRRISLLILCARTNRLHDLEPLVPAANLALASNGAGQGIESLVGTPHTAIHGSGVSAHVVGSFHFAVSWDLSRALRTSRVDWFRILGPPLIESPVSLTWAPGEKSGVSERIPLSRASRSSSAPSGSRCRHRTASEWNVNHGLRIPSQWRKPQRRGWSE
jgi:hypothetical protein